MYLQWEQILRHAPMLGSIPFVCVVCRRWMLRQLDQVHGWSLHLGRRSKVDHLVG